jgi:SAM-dependent methyltransferase
VQRSAEATKPAEQVSDDAAAALIERSISKYRRSHRRYDRKHPEIFNPVEQARLRDGLAGAIGEVRSADGAPRALDLGCGTGNITAHLLELGAHVVAADVSPDFLAAIERRFADTGRVETLELNGRDLSNLPGASVDLVCAYSVLHHIPDYLGAIDEVCRVLRPGGVAYLDHEVNETFWDKQGPFWQMLRAVDDAKVARQNRWNGGTWWDPRVKRWQRYLQPSKYHLKVRQMINPAYPWDVEGDIHVWEHDHIEWDRVEQRLEDGGCEVLRRTDYLNYSSDYPDDVWERFKDTCTNMRLVVARRTEPAR